MKPAALCLALAALFLQSCGFTPVYATREGATTAGLRNINLVSVAAQPSIEPLVMRAFTDRQALAGANATAADYDLSLEAEEFAQRLAVQIDASVTRFNYILRASYTLIRRSDGHRIRGSAETITSFNVVTSQYSTLFAENAAREKAARALMEEIERDILLRIEENAPPEIERRERPEIEFNEDYSR